MADHENSVPVSFAFSETTYVLTFALWVSLQAGVFSRGNTQCQLMVSLSLPDILSAAFWRSSGVFQNSYLRDMACITDGMSTLGPVVVAQQVVDPGHLLPPPWPTRSVCSHCYDILNEDHLIISWYLHVWNGVAVARNPPACPAEKRSLSENLVTVWRIPCSGQVRLRTEAGMTLGFVF